MENQQNRVRKTQLSNSIREIIVQRIKNDGVSAAEVARSLRINASTVRTVMHLERKTGRIKRIVRRNRQSYKLSDDIKTYIENAVEHSSFITLKEIQININQNFGLLIGTSTIDRQLKNLKITLKRSTIILDRVNDFTRLNLRREFSGEFLRSMLDDSKHIFIDECGFNLHLRRGYGRSLSGKRVTIQVPTIRGRNCTLLAAMNNNGILHQKIFYGGCTGEIFAAFLQELDVKLEKNYSIVNGIMFMDNARPHISRIVEDILHLLKNQVKLLSPYSYMLNPIEFAFSKIKGLVRKSLINSEASLNELIMSSLCEITREDCSGWYRLIRRNCAMALELHRFE